MLVMTLLIPSVMLFFGRRFYEKPPQKINTLFGYRSKRSMKDFNTWVFAHHYFGRLWYRMGWPVLIGTIVIMLTITKQDTNTVGIIGGALVLLQLIPLLAVVPATERALKRELEKR